MASFVFSGTSVTWVTLKGPDQGMAQILIDGDPKQTVDNYAPTKVYQVKRTIPGLANKAHTITVKVLGTKRGAAKAADVVVDGFIVGKMTEDTSTGIKYDTWVGTTNANASGGSFRMSSAAGAYATYKFSGTGINWITAKGKDYGKAQVLIDGVIKSTKDLYSATPQGQVGVPFTGLSDGPHTIQINVLGTRNIKSTGYRVVVDAFSGPITTVGPSVPVPDSPEEKELDTSDDTSWARWFPSLGAMSFSAWP